MLDALHICRRSFSFLFFVSAEANDNLERSQLWFSYLLIVSKWHWKRIHNWKLFCVMMMGLLHIAKRSFYRPLLPHPRNSTTKCSWICENWADFTLFAVLHGTKLIKVVAMFLKVIRRAVFVGDVHDGRVKGKTQKSIEGEKFAQCFMKKCCSAMNRKSFVPKLKKKSRFALSSVFLSGFLNFFGSPRKYDTKDFQRRSI